MVGSGSLVEAHGLYIGGEWIDPESDRYDVVNPANETVIGTAPDASVEQVQQAVSAARAAFDSGPWPRAEPAERARCLQQLSDALLAKARRSMRSRRPSGVVPQTSG